MRETPLWLIHGNSLSCLLLVSGEVSRAETVDIMGCERPCSLIPVSYHHMADSHVQDLQLLFLTNFSISQT